ncbi:MAG TPA: class I SAM-dependent methyltransferase [Chlamydiales bacterium]|nr:class I SAM-dependent methyltransferase [Chlamydiales bacterium]
MNGTFSPHLALAKRFWTEHLKPGDAVIDATCGNGHDTLFLAQLLLPHPYSLVAAYDIQVAAIQNTEALLQRHLPPDQLHRVLLNRRSHTDLELPFSPHLVVYNLGYLPGGDKTITTQTESTLASVQKSLAILAPAGALSITCYPGHAEGEKEEKALLSYLETLPSNKYTISHHKWLNRPNSPTLLWIKKVVTDLKPET